MNVHMRKRQHSGGGMNRHRQQKHGRYNNNQQRPRKNYRVLQEKYLNMAKEAMGSGDRILAEYYLQHADHYFRMQMEFMEERNRNQEQRPGRPEGAEEEADDTAESEEEDVNFSGSSGVLPAFITRKATPDSQRGATGERHMPVQDWEERDTE